MSEAQATKPPPKAKAPKNMDAQEGEYMGRPTIQLWKDAKDKHPVTFGLYKARLIVKNFEAVKAFVLKHDSKDN